MEETKTPAQLLEEKLLSKKESCYKTYSARVKDRIKGYVADYMKFMNAARTEREFTAKSAAMLEAAGFSAFDEKNVPKPGEKIYFNNRGRSLIAAVIGQKPLDEGARIVAAHVDSPRLDLKPNPLYEDGGLGYFKTHYYGGVKKYQWATIPLALHGVVIKKDGSCVEVEIGEKPEDPVFCITDILPHLAANVQDKRTSREVIKGEELNILLGSEPVEDEKIKEPVKLNLMRLLNEKYGITEADFNSAELEVIPALPARFVGLDKSLVGAYAHDDRVCAYAGLSALLAVPKPDYTAICILADKEEIGSVGNTGLASDMLRNFLVQLCRASDVSPERLFHNSKCLSADVNAAVDPNYSEVHEARNAARLGYGPVVTKYTGSGGKYGTNDASAELMGEIRALLDGADVPWQTGELGKVDEGGGGTVAQFVARLGIEVVDIGAPLLSMHAPFEIASVVDIYAMFDAFCAFFQ